MLMEPYNVSKWLKWEENQHLNTKPMWEKFPLSFERFLLFVFISVCCRCCCCCICSMILFEWRNHPNGFGTRKLTWKVCILLPLYSSSIITLLLVFIIVIVRCANAHILARYFHIHIYRNKVTNSLITDKPKKN